jgi:hypothetical protein
MLDREQAAKTTWWKVLFWCFVFSYGGRVVSQLGSGQIVISIFDILGSLTVALLLTGVWQLFWGRRR